MPKAWIVGDEPIKVFFSFVFEKIIFFYPMSFDFLSLWLRKPQSAGWREEMCIYLVEIESVEIIFAGIGGTGTQIQFTGRLVAVEPRPFQASVVIIFSVRHIDDAR